MTATSRQSRNSDLRQRRCSTGEAGLCARTAITAHQGSAAAFKSIIAAKNMLRATVKTHSPDRRQRPLQRATTTPRLGKRHQIPIG